MSLSVGNFSCGSRASCSFNQIYAEVDLYITYTKGGLSATLFDYHNENEADMASAKYFTWDRNLAGHAPESTIAWNGTENFSLRVLSATFLYRNDRNADGKQYYSTYCELGYSFNLNNHTIDLFLCDTPTKGLYHTNANKVNLGLTVSKDVKVTDLFSQPLLTSFIVNPAKEDVYFIVGLAPK